MLEKAFYNSNGTPSQASRQYAKLANQVKTAIEDVFPEAETLNKDVQLYKFVDKFTRQTSEREANKITKSFIDKFFQTIPAAGGVGVGLATGNPIMGLLTALAGAGASKTREGINSPAGQTRMAALAKNLGEKQLPQGVNNMLQALQRYATVRGTEATQ
jgi:hypothetical protein